MTWKTVLILGLAGLAAAVAGTARAGEPRPRVFVLQSYDPEYVWTRNINQGVRDALAGLDAAFEYFYLDAKRQPDPGRLRQAADEALRRIRQWEPHVVVSVDDAAQALAAAPHLRGRDSPQVVFCGVNAPLSLYGFPAANVSGVRERWHYREGFALLKRMVPSLRRVAFLVEESESGRFVLDDLREEERRSGPFALELAAAETVRTFQEWRRLILLHQGEGDALALGLYNALVDEITGRVVSPDAVMAWTNSVNARPTLGFSDIAKDHGLLCGVLESGHEQGYLAGKMAREILVRGVAAGSLPVEINVRGVVLVNLKAAEALGVQVPYEIIEAAGVVLR